VGEEVNSRPPSNEGGKGWSTRAASAVCPSLLLLLLLLLMEVVVV